MKMFIVIQDGFKHGLISPKKYSIIGKIPIVTIARTYSILKFRNLKFCAKSLKNGNVTMNIMYEYRYHNYFVSLLIRFPLNQTYSHSNTNQQQNTKLKRARDQKESFVSSHMFS